MKHFRKAKQYVVTSLNFFFFFPTVISLHFLRKNAGELWSRCNLGFIQKLCCFKMGCGRNHIRKGTFCYDIDGSGVELRSFGVTLMFLPSVSLLSLVTSTGGKGRVMLLHTFNVNIYIKCKIQVNINNRSDITATG